MIFISYFQSGGFLFLRGAGVRVCENPIERIVIIKSHLISVLQCPSQSYLFKEPGNNICFFFLKIIKNKENVMKAKFKI